MQPPRCCVLALLAVGSTRAHMAMKDPPPLLYAGNPFTTPEETDWDIINPLAGAEQYPCKGRAGLVGTPQGQAVQTWAPGEQATVSLAGVATHNGGSCQLSLSYDRGATFTVVKSFVGGCPQAGASYDFVVPPDAPEADDVLLAWTWLNKTGRREFYMSCAVVSIRGGSSSGPGEGGGGRAVTNGTAAATASKETKQKRVDAVVPFVDRPQVFVANLGGDFCTEEGVDIVFPDPGPDVENKASNPGPPIRCANVTDQSPSVTAVAPTSSLLGNSAYLMYATHLFSCDSYFFPSSLPSFSHLSNRSPFLDTSIKDAMSRCQDLASALMLKNFPRDILRSQN